MTRTREGQNTSLPLGLSPNGALFPLLLDENGLLLTLSSFANGDLWENRLRALDGNNTLTVGYLGNATANGNPCTAQGLFVSWTSSNAVSVTNVTVKSDSPTLQTELATVDLSGSPLAAGAFLFHPSCGAPFTNGIVGTQVWASGHFVQPATFIILTFDGNVADVTYHASVLY